MSDFPSPTGPPRDPVAAAAPGWYFDGRTQRWWDGASWGPVQPDSDDSTLATLSHFGTLLGGFILPLVFYFMSDDERRPQTRYHAREALNFQLTFLVLCIPGALILFGLSLGLADQGDDASGVLVAVFVGLILLIGLFSILSIVWGVIGAVRANDGQGYRYPINIRFITR